MDEKGFIEFMKNAKRSEGTIHRYVKFMTIFEDFLEGRDKTLDNATPDDFDSFLKVVEPKYRYFSYISGIRNYYNYTGNDLMKYALDELDYERPQPYKLTRHIGVNQECVDSLVSLGIKLHAIWSRPGKPRKIGLNSLSSQASPRKTC